MNPAKAFTSTYCIELFNSIFADKQVNERFIQSFIATIGYRVIELDCERAYAVYMIRSRLPHWNSEQKVQFEQLLKNLKDSVEEKVLIHIVPLVDISYLFFTSVDNNTHFGYLSLNKNASDTSDEINTEPQK